MATVTTPSALKTADPERYETLCRAAATARATRSRNVLLRRRVEAILFLNDTVTALSAEELAVEPKVRS